MYTTHTLNITRVHIENKIIYVFNMIFSFSLKDPMNYGDYGYFRQIDINVEIDIIILSVKQTKNIKSNVKLTTFLLWSDPKSGFYIYQLGVPLNN